MCFERMVHAKVFESLIVQINLASLRSSHKLNKRFEQQIFSRLVHIDWFRAYQMGPNSVVCILFFSKSYGYVFFYEKGCYYSYMCSTNTSEKKSQSSIDIALLFVGKVVGFFQFQE